MSAPGGILDSFAKIVKIASKKDKSTPLIYIIEHLNELKFRLGEVRKKLENRYQELIVKYLQFRQKNDVQRMAVIAEECKNVESLLNVINVADIAFERVIERLRTIDIVSDVRAVLSVTSMLNELKYRLSEVMPEIATAIDSVVNSVNSLVSVTKAPAAPQQAVTITKEVEEMFKEIETQARERIMRIKRVSAGQDYSVIEELERIASPQPAPSITPRAAVESRSVVEAVPTAFHVAERVNRMDLELAVLEYIRRHGGFINVSDCAKRLGVSREQVIEALKALERRGLIRIAR